MKEFEDGDGGGWQKCEKRKTVTLLAIINFFWNGTEYKKNDHAQLKFIENWYQLFKNKINTKLILSLTF